MQKALDLGLHGHHLHTADGSDLLDLFVLQKQLDQLPLGGGELGYIVDKKEQALFRAAQPVVFLQHHLLDAGIHHGVPRIHAADVLQQLGVRAALYNVIRRAGGHGGEDGLFGLVGGQVDHAGVNARIPDGLRRHNSGGEALHLNVHEHHIALYVFGQLQNFRSGGRCAHHLHVRLGVQQLGHILPQKLQVLRNQNRDHFLTPSRFSTTSSCSPLSSSTSVPADRAA